MSALGPEVEPECATERTGSTKYRFHHSVVIPTKNKLNLFLSRVLPNQLSVLDMARSTQWCEHSCAAYSRIAVSGGRGGAQYLVTALCHRGSSDSSESECECGMASRVNGLT